jgi:hypothetical protein
MVDRTKPARHLCMAGHIRKMGNWHKSKMLQGWIDAANLEKLCKDDIDSKPSR